MAPEIMECSHSNLLGRQKRKMVKENLDNICVVMWDDLQYTLLEKQGAGY